MYCGTHKICISEIHKSTKDSRKYKENYTVSGFYIILEVLY